MEYHPISDPMFDSLRPMPPFFSHAKVHLEVGEAVGRREDHVFRYLEVFELSVLEEVAKTTLSNKTFLKSTTTHFQVDLYWAVRRWKSFEREGEEDYLGGVSRYFVSGNFEVIIWWCSFAWREAYRG